MRQNSASPSARAVDFFIKYGEEEESAWADRRIEIDTRGDESEESVACASAAEVRHREESALYRHK